MSSVASAMTVGRGRGPVNAGQGNAASGTVTWG